MLGQRNSAFDGLAPPGYDGGILSGGAPMLWVGVVAFGVVLALLVVVALVGA